MAGKYYQKIDGVEYDVTKLCEAKLHTAAPGFGDSDSFQGEGSFQNPGTDTENITLSSYTSNGTPITTVKCGCYPWFNASATSSDIHFIWSSSMAGSFTFYRSTDKLIVGSTEFGPDSFRCGVVPEEYIVVVVGGGGGGGGTGYTEYEKNTYKMCPGGAGGGGGIVVARIKLPLNTTHLLVVGTSGNGGTSGDIETISSGATGTSGGASSIYTTTATGGPNLKAPGGTGGSGGAGASRSDGTPGTGGSGGNPLNVTTETVNRTSNPYNKAVSYRAGGNGNYKDSYSNTAITAIQFNPYKGNTGSTATAITNSRDYDGSDHNWYTAANGSGVFSGGCSYGLGASARSDGKEISAGSGSGGGSGGGRAPKQGGIGRVIIFY